jgi:hypothetical protein
MPPLLVIVVATLWPSPGSLAKAPPKFERWLGRDTIRVLENGDRVEIFAVGATPTGPRGYLDDNTGYLPPGTPATIEGFPVRRVAASQGRPFAQQVARLILDERSYDPRASPFGGAIIKGCIFSPGVAFRVWARKTAIDILLCFNCDQVSVTRFGGSGRRAGGDIDPARASFVRLAKSVLDDVPEVMRLPETRK